MPGNLLMVPIPTVLAPVNGLGIGTPRGRLVGPLVGCLGRRIPCHCLVVLALIAKIITAMASLVDR